MIVIVEAELE
ncbi:MAG: hypothetical protein EZS28_033826, partial [Streblomastix strix]